jgi:hypothetical protein
MFELSLGTIYQKIYDIKCKKYIQKNRLFGGGGSGEGKQIRHIIFDMSTWADTQFYLILTHICACVLTFLESPSIRLRCEDSAHYGPLFPFYSITKQLLFFYHLGCVLLSKTIVEAFSTISNRFITYDKFGRILNFKKLTQN